MWNAADHTQAGSALHHDALGTQSLAFSPDGRLLASGHSDGTIRLWDLAARRLLGIPLSEHDGPVTTVRFIDDRTLASWSEDDKTVRLWDIGVAADPLSAVCRIAGRPLNRVEWRIYLPGRPYRPSCTP